jgi:hypothetical protein
VFCVYVYADDDDLQQALALSCETATEDLNKVSACVLYVCMYADARFLCVHVQIFLSVFMYVCVHVYSVCVCVCVHVHAFFG